MNSCRNYIVVFLWIFVSLVLALLLFTKGFLLKRLEIDQHSGCQANFTPHSHSLGDLSFNPNTSDDCWINRRFDRAIVIIIDALRHDFALYDNTISEDKQAPYRNKLKIFNELLTSEPNKALLFKFKADPPTTTMQRLKGLTTGSLPTFVDAGSNFASAEISEDNIIRQLAVYKRNITFMGDDTWLDLFPDHFNKAFPYPSFNVKDLHTVDNGVLEHLLPELRQNDWDILIGHFLGVDHCGHRYGPNHPAMAEKLNQMDKVIRSVVSEMEENTLLMVFGDHGMTPTGDHGGDSKEELDAALFLYSPAPITTTKLPEEQQVQYDQQVRQVSQIDLVPTLSLLLGLPIPFSNLGSIIEELFTTCSKCEAVSLSGKLHTSLAVAEALSLNANQVYRYLVAYQLVSSDFAKEKLAAIHELMKRAEDISSDITSVLKDKSISDLDKLGKIDGLTRLYKQVLAESKDMCEAIWAKFDMTAMNLGIWSFTVGILFVCSVLARLREDALEKMTSISSFGFILAAAWLFALLIQHTYNTIFQILLSLSLFGTSFLLLFEFYTKVIIRRRIKVFISDFSENIHNISSMFTLIAVSLSSFSNSFVVYENAVVTFLIHSLIWTYCYSIIHQLNKPRKSISVTNSSHKKTFGPLEATVIILCSGLSLCLSISTTFQACREEQWPCEQSSFLQPVSALTGEAAQLKSMRYLMSVAMVVLTMFIYYRHMRKSGNLNDLSVSVLTATYSIPVCGLCTCLHWALHTLPSKRLEVIPPTILILFPRIVYAVTICSILVTVVKPLLIYMHQSSDTESLKYYKNIGDNLVPKLYNHVKMNWKAHLPSKAAGLVDTSDVDKGDTAEKTGRNPPVVYGLATVYSAPLLLMLVLVALVLMLLLGDGISPAVLLQLLLMFGFLELHTFHSCLKKFSSAAPVPVVSWSSVVVWTMLGYHFFFTTGHHATITSIKWEAAFVGFHGDFEKYMYPVAAMLLTMNFFASHILTIVGLPLIVLWPAARWGYYRNKVREYKEPDAVMSDAKGEFSLHENGPELRTALLKVLIYYILVHAVRLLGSMCAAAVLRRHLMVWKIFAPRFVVEGALFLLSAILPVVYMFVIRIHTVLAKWVEHLS